MEKRKGKQTMPNHNRTDVFHENDDNFVESFLLCVRKKKQWMDITQCKEHLMERVSLFFWILRKLCAHNKFVFTSKLFCKFASLFSILEK